MSETAVNETESAVDAHDEHDAHAHPTEGQYWVVFVLLAAITAFEVLWSYLGLSGPSLVVPLLVMMVVKFIIVCGVFMHLYFDMKMLNGHLFTVTFVAGIILAMAVYTVMVATFEFSI